MALDKTDLQTQPRALPENRQGSGDPRLAYRITDVCKVTGLGRTSVYAALKAGELIGRKWGRSTIVLADELAAFLKKLPSTRVAK